MFYVYVSAYEIYFCTAIIEVYYINVINALSHPKYFFIFLINHWYMNAYEGKQNFIVLSCL